MLTVIIMHDTINCKIVIEQSITIISLVGLSANIISITLLRHLPLASSVAHKTANVARSPSISTSFSTCTGFAVGVAILSAIFNRDKNIVILLLTKLMIVNVLVFNTYRDTDRILTRI